MNDTKKKKAANPSEHQADEISSPDQIYFSGDLSSQPEQSAIYSNVKFGALGANYDGVCVSPQCELGKATRMPYIVLCPIIPLERFAFAQLMAYDFTGDEIDGSVSLTPEKISKLKEFKKSLVNEYMTNKTHRYYFLLGVDGPQSSGLIDFQITECVPATSIVSYAKKTVLKSPVREDVVTRFGGFISRIGTAPVKKEIRDNALNGLTLPILMKHS